MITYKLLTLYKRHLLTQINRIPQITLNVYETSSNTNHDTSIKKNSASTNI